MREPIIANVTFDPDGFLPYFSSCIDDAVTYARSQHNGTGRGGITKYIGPGYERSLNKVMAQQIDLRPNLFQSFKRKVLSSRIDDSRIAHLSAWYEAYWTAQKVRKSFHSGQKTLPTFRHAIEHLMRLLPQGFDVSDLASSEHLSILCEAIVEVPRARGDVATAVTNVQHILSIVRCPRFALPDTDRAALLSQIVSEGLLPAYQAGNTQALDNFDAALQKALRLNERVAVRILLATVRHMRMDFRPELSNVARHRNAFEARALLTAAKSDVESAFSRIQRLSIHHNALKGYAECGADTTTVLDIDGRRDGLGAHLDRLAREFKDTDYAEGAALAGLTSAKRLLQDGKIGDAENNLISGLRLVKPCREQMYLTANAALCEALGDLNSQHTGKPAYAYRWYEDAQNGFRTSGSWQRCERVAAKLKAVA